MELRMSLSLVGASVVITDLYSSFLKLGKLAIFISIVLVDCVL